MKKTIRNMNSIFFWRRMVLVLLYPLAIAGCDDAPFLKPHVFDMTRLNRDGSINDGQDYTKHPWACVLDNQTGMVWEVKSTEPGLHNINNTYTWYDSDKESNGGIAGKANGGTCAGSGCDTESYTKAVNAEKLCGFDDWYLPSHFEMGTIVDESIFYPGPTFPQAFFPEALAGKYWTDTTFKTKRSVAWAWRFDQGSEFIEEKSVALNVRLTHATKKPEELVKKTPE